MCFESAYAPDTPWYHRLLIGFDITDELFAITIARPGYLNPFYTYGAMLVTMPCWSIGTALGIIAGNLLSVSLVSAFSVALYGLFLAVIIPPAHQNKTIGLFVLISFVASYIANYLPYVCNLSDATRIILLTVILASVAAILFPIKQEEKAHNEQ